MILIRNIRLSIVFLFSVFFNIFSFITNNKNATNAAPLLGFLLYTLFHGLIDTTYWKNDLSFLFWLAICLTLLLKNIPKQEN